MSNEQLIEEIELSIEHAEAMVKLGDALDRLSTSNKDFQLLIEEGFFRDEAARVVQAKANPGMSSPEAQAVLDRQINAIGGLYQYFHKVSMQAEESRVAIESCNEALVEIEAEEGTE